MRRALLLLVLAAAALPAADDFDVLVRSLESHYGKRKMGVPLMGLVNFAVKVARPQGARGLKFALFEEVGRHPRPDAFAKMVGLDWQPFVRVEHRNGESTLIYAKPEGKDWKLIVANLEDSEAVVVEVKVNPKELAEWVEDPERKARGSRARDDWN
ncbi:MAG TPA: hypothetical protein DEH78_09655 [Solibacterales bacterium]|nr:hypothetical protein [Bryobacterales bacterium]